MSDPLPEQIPDRTDEQHLRAVLDLPPIVTEPPGVICADCRRPRTVADDYDYTPLQLITGRPLGWFNGDGEQMCGECLAATMRGERP